MALRKEIISELVSAIPTSKWLEIINKHNEKENYFEDRNEFIRFISERMNKEELIEFFLNSEIGYEQTNNRFTIYFNNDGSVRECYIPSVDYPETDWMNILAHKVREIITTKFNEKLLNSLIENLIE